MKIIHTQNNVYTLNFEPGEEVMAGITQFVKEHGIKAAHINGLGAASKVEIAFYNLETKEYERREFGEDVEILSLLGNIGIKEDKTHVVHVHGVFGRRDFTAFGGHIFKMVIAGAGEIHLTAFPGQINRAYDERTGLTLMCEQNK